MIRRAEKKDISRIHEILFQVQEVHAKGREDLFRRGGIKYTEKDLNEIIQNEKTPVFVYTNEQDRVLGYLFGIYEEVKEGDTSLVALKRLYIDDLCVDEKERGKHIGESLYRYVLEEARKNGCYHVTLHVWDCNPGAMAFYEKMGMMSLNRTLEQIL